jgi:CHAT domain-containing protein
MNSKWKKICNGTTMLCLHPAKINRNIARVSRRIIGLILLALLGLTTTLSIPVLSAQQVERTSEANTAWLVKFNTGDPPKSPLKRGTYIPPLKRGARGDRSYPSSSASEAITHTSNAQSLLQQGIKLYEAEQFSEAAAVWQQANSAFAVLGDNLGQALVLSNLSLTYQHLGQWEEAQRYISQSLNQLQASKDTANSPAHIEILAKALNAQGNLQWEKGQVEEALSTWKEATRNYVKAGNGEGVVITKINQSKALEALGLSRQAQEILQQVYQTLQQQTDSNLKATGLRHLGKAFRRVGKLDESQQVLEESLKLAEHPTAKSSVLLELGNTELALRNRAKAIGKKQEEQKHAQAAIKFYQQAASDSSGQLQAQLNQLSLLVETEQWSEVGALWPKIEQAIAILPPSRTAIYARLNFAQSLTCLQPNIDTTAFSCISKVRQPQRPAIEPPSWQAIAQILAIARQQAQSLQDKRAEAYALGQLGGLYELTQQWLEAQTLTQQALLLAETLQAPDIRYRWEWQLGRLLKKQGDIKGATAAYTRAVDALESIRADLLTVSSDIQFSFRDNVQPLYRGLVDLLLKTQENTKPSPENLKQAIREIDSLQLAELENFLGCNLSVIKPIDQVTDPNAAIIYPIVLEDRIAIIYELPGSEQPLGYQETFVPQSEVEQTLRALRDNLTVPGNTPEVLENAQKVYGWLIKPLEAFLEQSTQVKTLVFVLDGPLRNIPIAVLYDGKQYLIEKDYAIAVAPRIKLFSPKASKQKLYVQTGGVGIPQVIDGKAFPPIEKLKEELERISEKITTSQPLLDAEFTEINIQQQLQGGNFSAIHWKTHGVFSSDPEETYIAAYQERLLAQDLNSLIQTGSSSGTQPLELLVLSACETAQGDDRAVLGLAGIAVRTGARSVLSTLWVAKDAPNTEFMVRFYDELSKPGMTKAQAVHQAQLALIKEYGYTTPHIWATYVLVGNWL